VTTAHDAVPAWLRRLPDALGYPLTSDGRLLAAGVVPGFLAAGCASCGAGVLGVFGFFGTMAALPFEGNLLQLGGILMLLFFAGRTGNPQTCSIT
jgi:hypothetical protein